MGGNDGWAGMTDGRGWRRAGVTDGREWRGMKRPCSLSQGYRIWASPSVFMASQFVIPARGVIPTEAGIPADAADAAALRELVFPREASFPLNPSFRESRHSRLPSFPRKRESEAFATGRLALDCHFPIGVGDQVRGNDGWVGLAAVILQLGGGPRVSVRPRRPRRWRR